MESRTRIGVRPVEPEVVWYRMACSVGAASIVPYGGRSSWPCIHSSRVRNGIRRRSSSEETPSDVTPAPRSRSACHGTSASAQASRLRSLRTCRASMSSRGIVSCRGFQYGVSPMGAPFRRLHEDARDRHRSPGVRAGATRPRLG